MSVLWLSPAVWTAVALVVLPLIIHLLTQQRSRRVLFPSLRFLPTAQLAALRRRAVSDWPLLIVRMLIIAVAVAAMASPVLVSDERRGQWNTRVARAILTTHEADDVARLVQEEERQSFVTARFSSQPLADALRAATEWLRQQPPASREIVLIGDVREGGIASADLDLVDAHVGIRFLPVPQATADANRELSARGESREGRLSTFHLNVRAGEGATSVEYNSSRLPGTSRIRVLAAPEQQSHADAVLRAVLRAGVTFEPMMDDRAVTIAFAGATIDTGVPRPPTERWMLDVLERTPQVRGGESGGTLVVRATMPVTDDRAASVVADVLRSAYSAAVDGFEPRHLSVASLAAWSRPAAGSPPDAQPADEGDRRWFWGLTILLLASEHVLRGRKRGG